MKNVELLLYKPVTIRFITGDTMTAEAITGGNNYGIFITAPKYGFLPIASSGDQDHSQAVFFIPFTSILWIGY